MNNVETMFSFRDVPWHGLGTIVEEALTSEEALKMAGLDWTVRKQEIVHADRRTGYYMNVRESDETVLGIVGGRYAPVQNNEAFDFTDALVGNGITYETAGSLDNGKRIWLLAKMEDHAILGDVVEPYMVLTNSHDGFGCLKVCMTPVRVVCQNTLNLALRNAKRTWKTRHSGNMESKLVEAQETLELASSYMAGLEKAADDLHKIKVAPIQFDRLKNELFPVTEEMGKRKEESQVLLQEALTNAWTVDDLGNHRGTGWGFMNAISDMSTHKPPSRLTDKYEENRFMLAMDYPDLLDKSMNLLKELV